MNIPANNPTTILAQYNDILTDKILAVNNTIAI
jgi:hypothetical protein